MFYKQGRVELSRGNLLLPSNGIYDCFLSIDSNSDTKVVLSLSGFYSIS